jgi:DNA processing protein
VPLGVVHVSPLDSAYPSRLRSLARPPATLSVRGGSLEAAHAVAIVGSRAAHPEAASFAEALAGELALAGVVVVSGGALGIDAAAHRGALTVGGRTWVIAGTGCDHCFPPEHDALFERIGHGPGAMVWPFAPASAARAGAFVARNRVLVAMSDAVIVVQAGLPSGALNAAAHAVSMRKPLWVVPAAPWLGPAFAGSRRLLERGARPLQSLQGAVSLLAGAPLAPVPRAASVVVFSATRSLTPTESGVLAAVQSAPLHLDEIASRAHSPAPAVTAALLTLALEDVVVEGPPGFFRRKSAP